MARVRSVAGVSAPTPRPTRWALIYALVYLGLPLVAVLGLADLLLYLFFTHVLGRCYGLFCLL
ncbi:MAG: hypothetical protein KDE35_12955 [Geminicoccaceae bacterium]|nr:hypothetical protein [Geminicoccaceae bacterium]